jgi:hypothetical protein
MALSFTSQQLDLIHTPVRGRTLLQGPAGSGKTNAAVARLVQLLQNGIPAEQILVLVPQRTLAAPYFAAIRHSDFPPGGEVTIQTLGGLAQRMLDLFWPLVSGNAGFAHPDQPPVFLTIETAQYFLARIVNPLLDQGYFDSIAIDHNRLLGQIIDNLNKAAGVGFPHTSLAERLKAAWIGETSQVRAYDEAQECAILFRNFCLQNNLLDFSLQLEVFRQHLWSSFLCRSYLTGRYRHLIYDNIEEDIPVAHDLINEWLPHFESALLILDSDGGFRAFLGADPQSAALLGSACENVITFEENHVTSPELQFFSDNLSAALNQETLAEPEEETEPVVSVRQFNFVPQMIEDVCQTILARVNAGTPPGEIVILAPFVSDSLRFSLLNRLTELGIPGRSHRPSRSLRDEPASTCLLTLTRLAHPQWKLPVTRTQLRSALMQAIEGLDLVRASLLTEIVYKANRAEPLTSFDIIKPEMQERITYRLGNRYEQLRQFLLDYRAGEPVELDVFLSRLFGNLLSQTGFAFHTNFDSAAVTARLIESVQKFRRVTGPLLATEDRPLGLEYLSMIENGVLAAQYLGSWTETDENAVLIAPAYTFVMMNRPVDMQIWLDIGSVGWWQRLYQPLTHPIVLSRRWQPDAQWTDVHEYATNQQALTRLTTGLLRRCRSRLYLRLSSINAQGDEQRGPLLQAVQTLLRHAILTLEDAHV